jgi:predicted RNA binding protein YcfA (HicA-like mRNA interferase family)
MKKLKVREILKLLKADGWYQLKARHTSGDHRQFKHPTKPGKVTVNGKPNDDMRIDDQRSIFNQAGWEWK